MGQGGYLNLVNVTPYVWNRTGVHSYKMKSWDNAFPVTLGPGQQELCYIEFKTAWFNFEAAGEVTYSFPVPTGR